MAGIKLKQKLIMQARICETGKNLLKRFAINDVALNKQIPIEPNPQTNFNNPDTSPNIPVKSKAPSAPNVQIPISNDVNASIFLLSRNLVVDAAVSCFRGTPSKLAELFFPGITQERINVNQATRR